MNCRLPDSEIRNLGKQPLHSAQRQSVATLVATFALVLAAVMLSSCAGYTSASSSQKTQGQAQSSSSGVLSASSTSVGFGSVTLGNSMTQSLIVTNTGTAAVTVTQDAVSGTGFSIVGASTAGSIPIGQSATIQVQFVPQSAGAATGSLTVTSDASDSTLTVALSGTGTQAGLSAAPSSVNFGSVVDGSSNSQPITLKNTGTANLTISQYGVTGAGFSITGLSAQTVLPGNSITFSAVFAPAAAGSASGGISLTTDAPGSPVIIPLTGAGVAPTLVLGANPTNLSFAGTNVGGSNSLGVTLTNNGNSNITISGVSSTNAAFTTSGAGAGTILTPGQSATLNVVFAPTAAGSASGTVIVASNAASAPTISVSGTGAQPASHSVDLSWGASSSTDVVGYNVYQGTVSGGPYAKLTSALVSASLLQYVDSTVQSGHTYYYVVTAVDSSNDESAYSNQVSAAIP
ncbi:MAG: choice-of-anchor D domain-containing protein [Candidatus Acidiferrales bacterium]